MRRDSAGKNCPFKKVAWTLVLRPKALRGQLFWVADAPGNPKKPVFDFRAHFCHSAPVGTHAFGFTLPAQHPTRRARSDFLSVQGIKTMNALEVTQHSIDAWNRHDADALVALYAEGGTYHNPRMDHALTGQAIADFAKSVWAAYPDMWLRSLVVGTPEEAWSPPNGCYTAPTPVRSWTAPRLPVVPSPIRGLSSLRLRAIRSARSAPTLTGRR